MNNLSLREKAIMYILVLVVIALLAYIFGIRTLNNKNADLQVELQTLEQRKAELDILKQENENTRTTITTLKDSIVTIEHSFIRDLKTENVERYVLGVMEDKGMPYLAEVNSEDVQMDAIILADGTASNDFVRCKRINIEYATTDGYEIEQYNLVESNKDAEGNIDAARVNYILNNTGKFDASRVKGYNEFIDALKAIEKTSQDDPCIKITKFSAESTHGYMTMKASIDFYGAELSQRVSDSESDKHLKSVYAGWSGDSSTVFEEEGLIGMPYKVDKPGNMWHGVMIDPSEVNGFIERPFAAYLSNARFTMLIQDKGLAYIVGGGIPTGDADAARKAQEEADNAA